MLSLCELQRAVRILQERLRGAALRRMNQSDEHTFVLIFEISTGKYPILLSCRPESARICSADLGTTAFAAGSFYQYLHAHLIGSSLAQISIMGKDRLVGLQLQSRSGQFTLIFSILGARSNIYLLDADAKLVHCLRPLDETRRELVVGEPWINPRGSAPSAGADRWEEVQDAQYLDAIAQAYQQLESRLDAEALAHKIEHVVKKERAFLGRKLINLQEDFKQAQQADISRKKGELLKNVLHSVKHGDAAVMATDYQTGEDCEIALDPMLSPAANLEAYFSRYQKEQRGVKMIQQQLEDVNAALADWDAVSQQVEEALKNEPPDGNALESIAAKPNVRRFIQRQFPKQKTSASPKRQSEKNKLPTRLQPKRYKTQDGLEIWVGRSDEGNDHLTTRLARGNDLFFHLDGYPGSHVVLRTEGRTDPPASSLLDACELAVHFSKMKNAGRADVHVAPIKDVKKPKGAKPGLVYVRSGRSIHLKRDAKRLQGILASRLDWE